MTTVKNIFDYIQTLNPTVSCVSSLGHFVDNNNLQTSLYFAGKIEGYLPKGTLARTILDEVDITRRSYSSKQLWVIAYQLIKSEDFIACYEKDMAEIRAFDERQRNARRARRQRRNQRKENN